MARRRVLAHKRVMDAFSPQPFAEAAHHAFPPALAAAAEQAAAVLWPFVDDTYRQGAHPFDIQGQPMAAPGRLHFVGLGLARMDRLGLMERCLVSRATDGRLRQAAVQSILASREDWVAPYVLLPLCEYVIEIVEDIRRARSSLDQRIYGDVVRENRQAMRTLRARAISYWNAYHRERYPLMWSYPALRMLDEMESWSAEATDGG